MTGMSRTTGATIGRSDHIRQSIGDILSTHKGTRVMRRDYGCYLTPLVDAPYNATTASTAVAVVLDALTRWEPRITVKQVSLTATADGKAAIRVVAVDNVSGDDVTTTSVMGGA